MLKRDALPVKGMQRTFLTYTPRNLKPNAPLLTMARTAFDDSGSAVEFGTHCYRASRYYFDTTLVDR